MGKSSLIRPIRYPQGSRVEYREPSEIVAINTPQEAAKEEGEGQDD